MSDLSPPWGNATKKPNKGEVVIHTKKAPHHTICVVPASTGAARMGIARLLQAAPDLYRAAQTILEEHAKKWGGEPCGCEDCQLLEHAIGRADGNVV